jgi:hypothetical protein
MDHEITGLQALSLWQHGELPKDLTLWGHHLYFWGRLGRVLEIISAFAVVIDLLGADRLTALAKELRDWHDDPTTRAVNVVRRPGVVLGGVLTIAALAALALLTGSEKLDPVLPFTDVPLPPGLAFIAHILCMAAAAYFLLALYFVLFELVSTPLADYMARLLKKRHADKWLKLMTLPVLTLGFLLDLLGS